MSKQKRWPTNAEDARTESIAKARRIKSEVRDVMSLLRPISDSSVLATDQARRVADAALRLADAFSLAADIETLLNHAKEGSDDNGIG